MQERSIENAEARRLRRNERRRLDREETRRCDSADRLYAAQYAYACGYHD